MDFTGRLVSVSKDYESGEWRITFSCNETHALEPLSALKQADTLSVSANKFHKKRSLNANAYLWALCNKIAYAIGSTSEEVYEEMLQRYGVLEQADDKRITVTVASNVDMSKITGHWKYFASDRTGKWKSYYLIKGSSQYDSAEMAHLLDMIIEECKALGIETLSEDELERMKQAWNPS